MIKTLSSNLELPEIQPRNLVHPSSLDLYKDMLTAFDHMHLSVKENQFPNFSDMKQLLMSPLAKQTMEPSECLNLLNMSSLGEPDPTAISKVDLLSSITFDKRGQFMSVGDRGGRVIIFERKTENGHEDFDYFTEF